MHQQGNGCKRPPLAPNGFPVEVAISHWIVVNIFWSIRLCQGWWVCLVPPLLLDFAFIFRHMQTDTHQFECTSRIHLAMGHLTCLNYSELASRYQISPNLESLLRRCRCAYVSVSNTESRLNGSSVLIGIILGTRWGRVLYPLILDTALVE